MKKLLLSVWLIIISINFLNAQNINVPQGSIVIDMGVVPQTIGNGLKPYGLVYSLIKNFNTPVIWSINPTKTKDNSDFSADGRDFRGGTFFITAEFLTSAVLEEISIWESQGVITYKTVSNVNAPLYRTLKSPPNWVLDTDNGSIAADYLENAGIPVETATREALPTELTTCDDLFVLPHADPTWEEHGQALLDWNSAPGSGPAMANAGYIWSGCHAVSALEDLYNPSNPSEQTNFLSIKTAAAYDNGDDYYENALSLWGEHNNASEIEAYQNGYPAAPYMQFMGATDGAHAGGSEQIYLPVINGGWRSSTKVGAWDQNHEDLGTLSNGKAALIAFGPAFGDSERGFVMYEGGHELTNGTEEENVAAQRAFLNFSFDSAKGKVPSLIENMSPPSIIEGGNSINFDVTGTPMNGGSITYSWLTSGNAGSFNDPTSPTPVFTANLVDTDQTSTITVQVSDECGRISFQSWGITVTPAPAAPIANNDSYATYNTNTISFNVLDNDTDTNGNIDYSSFTLLTPLSVAGGMFVNNGSGNMTFNPDNGFSGTVSIDYQICDDTPQTEGGPLCATATLFVTVATGSCSSEETISSETNYAFSIYDEDDWKNSSDALGAPDFKYSKSNDSENGYIIYDLGGEAYIGSQLIIRYTSDKGNHVNGVIDVASTNSGFPNNPIAISTQDEAPVYNILYLQVQQAGIRYIKITGDEDFAIESIRYEKEICLEPNSELIEPTVNTQTTEDTTPIIRGTWGGSMSGDDSLSVNIDGSTYTEGNGLTIDDMNWELTVDSPLDYGAYNVFAFVIRNSSNQMIWDTSSNELFIVPSESSPSDAPVTSGNDGGLESNGNLAGLIAKRNFKRKKTGAIFNKRSLQNEFNKKNLLNQRNESATLINYLPETGVNGTETAYVSSPADLLGITNAQQVFSVDYYQNDNRIAAVLATETSGSVYDHSKIICDRLNSSSLEDAWAFSMNGHQVISSKLQRASGEIEYTLSFSVKLGEVNNELFSFWNIDQYPEGDFYNFQIWGSTYAQIFSICNFIIDNLTSEKPLNSISTDNVIPSVFVKSGYYANGEVHLNIVNKAGAAAMIFEGNISETEVSERYNFIEEIALNGALNQTISVSTGNLFDIGFSIVTNESQQIDALYLADGPWGVDYLDDYATVDQFDLENELILDSENLYEVERHPSISGHVKGNVNLFRHLLAGDQTLDMSDYEAIQFNIFTNQPVEIVLMQENLTDWNNRLRYTIPANTSETFYNISLNDFIDGNGNSVAVNDIKTVVFSIISDYSKYIPFTMNINSLAFGNSETLSIAESETENLRNIRNYPNPFKTSTTIMLANSTQYLDLKVMDMLGRIVDMQHIRANNMKAIYNAPELAKGMYKFKGIDDTNKNYTGTFLIN